VGNGKNQAACRIELIIMALAQCVEVKVIQQINSFVFKYSTVISIIYEFLETMAPSPYFRETNY
jgi:hypothetical protein